MRYAITFAALAALAWLGPASAVQAQTRGGQGSIPSAGSFGAPSSGSSSMFGNRSLGSSLSAGNRGFAGGGAQGANGGRGVANSTLQNDASVGQVNMSSDRFVRGNRQPGQFVGSDTSDLPSFLTNLATGAGQTNRNFGAAGNNRGGRNQNQANANQSFGGASRGGRNQQTPYRTSRSVAFEYQAPSATNLSATLTARFQRLSQIRTVTPVQVEVQNRTAILRGVVATDHDRDLAEQLARLEAGISQVQNELRVAQPLPPPTAEPQQP